MPESLEETAHADSGDAPSVGDCIEVCPNGIMIMEDIARAISERGGAALVTDYGELHSSENSLRGIYKHEFVSPLAMPGKVDLSCDVNFGALAAAAKRQSNVRCFGPVQQGTFLKSMGIETRLAALFQGGTLSEAQQENLYLSYERLCEEDQMGKILKALAICHEDFSGEGVAGF